MARALTKKQRGFVNDYADTGKGTKSALKNYDIHGKDPIKTASVIATQNLGKDSIKTALDDLGFNANNAKRVIAEIMNNTEAADNDRLNAADKVLKVHGTYAAEKHLHGALPTPILGLEEKDNG